MKHVDEMTMDECRDELAILRGWTTRGTRWYHPKWHTRGSGQKRHPIPPTQDAAADAIPPGWDVEITSNHWDGMTHWQASAWQREGPHRADIQGVTNRLLAEFRLAILCHRAAATYKPEKGTA